MYKVLIAACLTPTKYFHSTESFQPLGLEGIFFAFCEKICSILSHSMI